MRSAARFRAAVFSACWLLATAPVAFAQASLQVPAYTGYVNDFAGVIAPDTRASLTSLAERVNAATRGDMVIVTIADIGDRADADVAREIGRQWKVGANAAIGDRARNAGVIILLVPKETSSTNRGSCRIETGMGTEGFITDATSGSICREATPYFMQRDYSRGIELVASRVAQLYAREFNVTLDGVQLPAPAAEPSRRRGTGGGTNIVLIIVVVFIALSSLGRRGRGGSGCLNMLPFILAASGGGRSSGGWGGGGGGGFGGGGGGFGGLVAVVGLEEGAGGRIGEKSKAGFGIQGSGFREGWFGICLGSREGSATTGFRVQGGTDVFGGQGRRRGGKGVREKGSEQKSKTGSEPGLGAFGRALGRKRGQSPGSEPFGGAFW